MAEPTATGGDGNQGLLCGVVRAQGSGTGSGTTGWSQGNKSGHALMARDASFISGHMILRFRHSKTDQPTEGDHD